MWPWIWITIVILTGVPWALWFGGRRENCGGSALVCCLSLTFSLGSISLLMLAYGVIGISLDFWLITLPYLVLMSIGGILTWRNREHLVPLKLWPKGWVRRSIWLICIAIAIAQLINSSYWPFYRNDTLGIYSPYATEIYEKRALVSLRDKVDVFNRYDSYPMMLPLTFVYTYMSADGIQEYLAKTVSTLLAVATIPAAFLLGKGSHSEAAGWVSAGLLALTPAFWRWASAGYVDLPMAFFSTMAGYFALHLWQRGRISDAFLTGIHVGLACWMKNAGLVLLPLLAIWVGIAFYSSKLFLRHILVLAFSVLFAGSFWYLWTYWQAGVVVPNTAWTDRAQHSLETLLIFLVQWDSYGFVGWVIMVGLGFGLWKFKARGLADPGNALLLLWFIPFWFVWWWFVSYDPRFLLLLLPAACVVGAHFITLMWSRTKKRHKNIAAFATILCAAIWSLHGVLISVEYKDEILNDPFMSHEEKVAIVRPLEHES